MSKDFLSGILWGALASGKSDIQQKTDDLNKETDIKIALQPKMNRLQDEVAYHQRNSYVQTTKLEARIDTEKELLIQLADAGLSNDSRIPLANIKQFDESYLINLIKRKQDQSIIDGEYPDGMPSDVRNEVQAFNREKAELLKEQGYDLAKHGIKM